ncbi:hypothetical protein DWS23_18615 [Escherichia coli]|nr:hypothetical protein [Escherichia coli]
MRVVGLVRRDSVASGIVLRLPDAALAPYQAYERQTPLCRLQRNTNHIVRLGSFLLFSGFLFNTDIQRFAIGRQR